MIARSRVLDACLWVLDTHSQGVCEHTWVNVKLLVICTVQCIGYKANVHTHTGLFIISDATKILCWLISSEWPVRILPPPPTHTHLWQWRVGQLHIKPGLVSSKKRADAHYHLTNGQIDSCWNNACTTSHWSIAAYSHSYEEVEWHFFVCHTR